MYASHSNAAFSRAAAATSSPPLLSPMHHHFLSLTEFDSLHDTLSQLSNSPSPPPLASDGSSGLMQRSVSSQSLLQQSGTHHTHHRRRRHNAFSALFAELLDSEEAAVRRVYSTGDLQGINGMQHSNHSLESPLSSESSMIIEGMSRACRYSPEEKKLRIERYRSKRNQRNFNKKIKYACRKTLADSRPRIRGRFARNDEIDKNTPVQWTHIGATEEEDEVYENWVSIFDTLVAANLAQESQGNSSFGDLFY